MSELAGAVVYAVVPFAPEPPFRIFAGAGKKPFEVDTAKPLLDAARRGGDAEMSFIVPGKARPVLVISDGHDDRLDEVLALRLIRFGKLSGDEQEEVRGQQDPSLFHLPPDRFDLAEENAVMIASLVRVSRAALDDRPAGTLDTNELRVVHERVARHYRLDLYGLVRERLKQLGARQREQRG